jgi:hypothetical protein
MAHATDAKIDFIRPEVEARLSQYSLIEDCLEGEEAVKGGRERYLPMPNADDQSSQNKERYEAYLSRAQFFNIGWRTWRGLVDQAFTKPLVIELDSLLDVMKASVDGAGTTLEQQAKKADGELVSKGRVGLLADFPITGGPVSRQELQDGKVAPTIAVYTAAQIRNWRLARVQSQLVLTKLVLKERKEIDDGFALTYEDRWRVIEMKDGACTVMVYKRATDGSNGFDVDVPEVTVRDYTGQAFTFIPFQIVGAEDNDWGVDRPVMFDICSLNIGHFRNSADWEESCFIVGQPTPIATGLTEQWYTKVMKERIAMGSRGGVPLPQGGDFKLVQADPNTMAAEGMRDKEARMLALGAKLMQPKQVQQTASEVRINYATELSVVGTIANNLASAYTKVLEWCGLFVGATQAPSVKIGVDFSMGWLTAEELTMLSDLHTNKKITTSEFREALVKAGYAHLSLEEFQKEIDSQPDYTSNVLAAFAKKLTPNADKAPVTNEQQQQAAAQATV